MTAYAVGKHASRASVDPIFAPQCCLVFVSLEGEGDLGDILEAFLKVGLPISACESIEGHSR